MDGFLAVAGAELDDAAHRRAGDDVLRAGFENRVFRARQIVLRQFADLLEELRAALIVEVIGFEPARLIPQVVKIDRVGIESKSAPCSDQMPGSLGRPA